MPRERLHESELFRFINNETPTARSWLVNYLSKKGIPVTIEFPDEHTVAFFLENQLNRHGFNYEGKKALAREMANAWRGYRHRKNKNVVSITVGLDKQVVTKLAQMSRGLTQAQIITKLINHDYIAFVAMQNERKLKETHAKLAAQSDRDRKLVEKMLSKPQVATNQLNGRTSDRADLEEAIAKLYDMLFYANNQYRTIDNETFLQATRVYYSVFSK